MLRSPTLLAVLGTLLLLSACDAETPTTRLEVTRFAGDTAGFEFDARLTDREGAGRPLAGVFEVEFKYRDRVSRGARVLCRQTLRVSASDYERTGSVSQSGAWEAECQPSDEADVWVAFSFEASADGARELLARVDAPAELVVAPPPATPTPSTPPSTPPSTTPGTAGSGTADADGVLEIPALGIRVIVPEGSRTADSPGDLEESVAIETPIDDCRPAILPLPDGLGLDYAAAKEGCLGCEYLVDERDGENGWRLRFTMPGVPGWAITRGFELGGRMLSCRASAQTENGALCALAICDSVQAL